MIPHGPLIVKPLKDVFDEKYSFYGFVRRILCLYRYTGLLPISGLRNKRSESTRGLLKSWYSIIYLATLVLQGIRLIMITIELVLSTNRFEIMDKLANMLVALANYIALFFMLRLSLNWEVFVKQVESIEKLLPSTNDHRAITFTKYLIAAIFALAIIDFVLLNILIWRMVRDCPVSGVTNDYELFCKVIYGWLFQYLPFHYIWMFLLVFLHLQIHLLWNYIDIFIMIVAIYLYCKFENFNKILLQKQQSVSARGVASWSTLQVHYTLLSRLVTIIDDNINPTVLFSYFSNILFIMKQIFYITKDLQKSLTTNHENCLKMRTQVDTISYFTFTCCIVIARTGLISAFASNLHLASREPLHALHTFPSSAFNIDMQRLMSQVYYSRVSLTGYTFFGITRRMILAMVGTLITYELVLFQL